MKTPMTDAEAKRVRMNEDELTEPVSANFARRLELELAETKQLLAHKNETANTFMAQIKKLQRAAAQPNAPHGRWRM